MQDLEKLIVSLEANLKQYERELARAQKVTVTQLRKIEGDAAKSMGRVEQSFAKAGSFIAGFGKGFALGAITAGVAGLTALVATSIQTAAAIGDLGDKLGISSGKLQELNYGAVQADMDFKEFEKSLLKFSKSMGEARNGAGDLRKTLLANGFSEAEIRALDYSQALDVVADLVKNAANEQDAMLIVTQAFGRGGAPMLEFLRDGKKGLDDFGEAAQKANAIISEESVKSAQKFDDAWARTKIGFKSTVAEWTLDSFTWLNKFGAEVERVASRIAKFKADAYGETLPFSGGRSGFSGASTQTPAGGKGDKVTKIFNPEEEAARKKAAADRLRAYLAQQKAIEGVISALQFEAEQLVASDLQQQINNEHRKAGVTATSAQGQEITALVTKNFELARSIEEAEAAGEKFFEKQAELNEIVDDFGQKSFDALESIVSGGEKASDVLKKLAIEFIKTAIQARALQGAAGGGASGGVGGFFSQLFGGLFGGTRAGGGPVSAGKAYLVGEKRPELFVPSQSGSIIPKVGGSGELKVIINDNVGTRVGARERSNGMGQKELVVMIDQRLAQQAADPYSKSSSILSARGARPAMKQR